MNPLQRSAITRARQDADRYAPRPLPAWLAHIAQAIAIASAIVLVGLASYAYHQSTSVPQCLATSYDDCE